MADNSIEYLKPVPAQGIHELWRAGQFLKNAQIGTIFEHQNLVNIYT